MKLLSVKVDQEKKVLVKMDQEKKVSVKMDQEKKMPLRMGTVLSPEEVGMRICESGELSVEGLLKEPE